MENFLAIFASLLLSAISAVAVEKTSKPNIIFILADDLGIGNVRCYGADNFKTPRIDALVKGGIRFQHCFAQPLCGLSRAQILTGRYAFRTGMTGNDTDPLIKPENEIILPKVVTQTGLLQQQAIEVLRC